MVNELNNNLTALKYFGTSRHRAICFKGDNGVLFAVSIHIPAFITVSTCVINSAVLQGVGPIDGLTVATFNITINNGDHIISISSTNATTANTYNGKLIEFVLQIT